MALPVGFRIPVQSVWVPRFIERIIDKKVRGIALNCLEKFIDILSRCLYSPYSKLYRDKCERIHTFSDGQAKLYDCTSNGIASIKNKPLFPNGNLLYDFISLNEKRVFFHRDMNQVTVFGRAAFTDYVVVSDGETPNQIVIQEQEVIRPNRIEAAANAWTVDLNHEPVMRINVRGGPNINYIEPCYLAKARQAAGEEQVG